MRLGHLRDLFLSSFTDGRLMFQQVPMVEIDGMTLVQTRAILNYIATKYNLYGKDAKERALYGIFPVVTPRGNKENLGPSMNKQESGRVCV